MNVFRMIQVFHLGEPLRFGGLALFALLAVSPSFEHPSALKALLILGSAVGVFVAHAQARLAGTRFHAMLPGGHQRLTWAACFIGLALLAPAMVRITLGSGWPEMLGPLGCLMLMFAMCLGPHQGVAVPVSLIGSLVLLGGAFLPAPNPALAQMTSWPVGALSLSTAFLLLWHRATIVTKRHEVVSGRPRPDGTRGRWRISGQLPKSGNWARNLLFESRASPAWWMPIVGLPALAGLVLAVMLVATRGGGPHVMWLAASLVNVMLAAWSGLAPLSLRLSIPHPLSRAQRVRATLSASLMLTASYLLGAFLPTALAGTWIQWGDAALPPGEALSHLLVVVTASLVLLPFMHTHIVLRPGRDVGPAGVALVVLVQVLSPLLVTSLPADDRPLMVVVLLIIWLAGFGWFASRVRAHFRQASLVPPVPRLGET